MTRLYISMTAAFLFLIVSRPSHAQPAGDINPKNGDRCGLVIREKQYCFQKFTCSGSQYAIAYQLDKSAQGQGSKYVALCRIEDTNGGVDSCVKNSESPAAQDCRDLAIESKILLNQKKAETSTPESPQRNAEAELGRATS
jgi:hypothetical protein